MLETTELGLGESQELNAVGRDAGMLMDGTDGMCRDIDPSAISEGVGELVEESVLLVSLLSSIALRDGAAEVCSYGLSDGPPSAATTSGSEMPR
jgi:hypothetical protein